MHSAYEQVKAFTLIELSIVLVLIGLLVGSVLVGRDLISASQVRAQISQIQEMRTAMNAFRVKYNCIPGDCPNATDFFGSIDSSGHYIINGNGDGFIYGAGGVYGVINSPSGCLHADVTGKASQALLQLNDAGLTAYTANGNNDQTGIYHQAMVATAGKVFPYAKYDNKSGIFITCLQDSVWPTLTPSFLQYQNVIVFGTGSGWNAIGLQGNIDMTQRYSIPGPGTIGIPIKIIHQMDLKIDDGVPNSGKLGIVATDAVCGGATAGGLSINVTSYPAGNSTCLAVGGQKIE